MHTKPGYILITTFFLLTSAAAVLFLTAKKEFVHAQLTSTLITQHALKDSAYALLSCAPALFYGHKEEGDEKKEKETKKEPDFTKLIKLYFRYVSDFASLPKLNAPEQKDPFSGYLKISCESGKLNLNGVYDFTKKKWRDEKQKKFCSWLFESIAKETNTQNCFSALEKYLEERGCHFNDISELYEINEIKEAFPNNFAPVYTQQKTESLQHIYFSELFTVQTEVDTINALCLSPSMTKLLGGTLDQEHIQNIEMSDVLKAMQNKNQQEGMKQVCKELYEIEFDSLPAECKSLLTMNSELNIFAIAVSLFAKNIQTSMLAVVKIMPDKEKIGTLEIMKVYQT